MDYAKKEQLQEQLKNEAMQIELQLAGRLRDVDMWKAVREDPLVDAVAFDARIANNRDEECKQQLAAAAYDIIKLQTKLSVLTRELAKFSGVGA
jgi:hypothetical protein